MKTTGAVSVFGALAGLALWMLLDMLAPPGLTSQGGAFLIILCTLLAAAGEIILRKLRERKDKP